MTAGPGVRILEARDSISDIFVKLLLHDYNYGRHNNNHNTLLYKSLDMRYVKHELVKNAPPSYHVKHDDTQVPPKCSRAGKQAVSHHSVWLDLSLKRVLSVEFVELAQNFPRNYRS
jgi:hypothetical protein